VEGEKCLIKLFIKIIIFILIFLGQILATLLFTKKLEKEKDFFWKLLMIQQIAGIILSYIAIIITDIKIHISFENIIILGILPGLILTVITNGLDTIIRKDQEVTLPINTGSVIQHLICFGILVGISEELLFRGFLQNYLFNIVNGGMQIFNIFIPYPVMISGLLFGIIHLVNINVMNKIDVALSVIGGIVCGIIFGMIYYYTDNILLPILCHNVFDIGAYIFMRMNKKVVEKTYN